MTKGQFLSLALQCVERVPGSRPFTTSVLHLTLSWSLGGGEGVLGSKEEGQTTRREGPKGGRH